MCGRFSLAGIKELSKRFQIEKSVISLKPRYNIAPGQDIPVIVKVREQRILTVFRWGLIPSWAKDSTISNKLINASTIITTPSNSFLRPFHDRMPVILSPEQEKGWCDCNFQDVAQLKAMLKPCPVDWLDAYEVSPLINSVKVDDQRCIAMVNQTSFEF